MHPDATARGRRVTWIVLCAAAVLGAIGFATSALAAIVDAPTKLHYYGGFLCTFGGVSYLNGSGGTAGYSGTAILTSACTNGYRELYTEALTVTNQISAHYSDWKLYNYQWTFPTLSNNICQIVGSHRMSKAGVDTSDYLFTAVAGCFPA